MVAAGLRERDAPYVHLRPLGDRRECGGVAVCTLGTKLDYGNGAPPDGVFAEWNWDGQRLTVRNDRYGCYPLYYFADALEVAVSPSIPALLRLGAPHEFDDAAFAVFLRLGHLLGDDTLFKRIHALPPNATLTWHDGQLDVAGGSTDPKPSALSRDAALDGFITMFREAVRRRVPEGGDCVVALSGGEDSRHIAFALCEIERPPRRCVTYESWWGQLKNDPPVAAEVARALGVEHVVLHGHGSLLRAELRKNLATSFGSYRHPQVLLLRDWLSGQTTAVFEGLAGDLVRCDNLNPGNLRLMEAGRFEAMARNIFGSIGERFMPVLAPALQRRFGVEQAVARLTAELARHVEAANPIGSFVFWNLVRREIALASYLLSQSGRRLLLPYLDHGLYDHVMSLPAALLLDHRFHRDAIARAYPRYTSIPFAVGAMTRWHRWHVRRYAAELLGYVTAAPSQVVRRPLVAAHLLQIMATGWASPLGALGPHPEKLARIAHLLQLERSLAG
ncbi:MAG TPA: asparagine synthase-related protein [Candidatus Kryptonia bacterium]|nr:asparagine synthase-related protein [Candidatus Kryptonia bacterium]